MFLTFCCAANRPYLKICCTDVTTSCVNSVTINVYFFVDVMLFTKKSIVFGNILRLNKCYTARQLLKEFYFKQLSRL